MTILQINLENNCAVFRQCNSASIYGMVMDEVIVIFVFIGAIIYYTDIRHPTGKYFQA